MKTAISLKFFALLLALGASGQTLAATLRSSTTLQQPSVRISDLFDEAGPLGERVLGPGPAPGAQIVVEAAQAAAIARQFGIAWRPATLAERVVIDRPGRLVSRDQIIAAVRVALRGAGASEDGDLELPGFVTPMVASENVPQLGIEQVDFDQATGRFTATLIVTVLGELPQRSRLSGRHQEMVELVVPTHRLMAGAVIRADDVQLSRLHAGPVHAEGSRGELVHDVGQAIGQSTRRTAAAGQPLILADIGRPYLVQKGAKITIILQSPGLSMSVIGQASEPGALGDMIGVLNPASGAVVDAEVIAADQVRVSPASSARRPIRPTGAQVTAR